MQRLFMAVILLVSMAAEAQDLSQHRWKNRLILILTNSENTEAYKSQVAEFSKDKPGMDERKLVIYSVKPELYKKGITAQDWKKSSELYTQYKKGESDLEVILMGLDGGVKLRQTELLTNDKLFAIIDGMPMRRAEMRREKK